MVHETMSIRVEVDSAVEVRSLGSVHIARQSVSNESCGGAKPESRVWNGFQDAKS